MSGTVRTASAGTATGGFTALDHLAINTVRALAVDMVQAADSGHPGLPLGAAPMAYVLWQRHLRHDPRDPFWPDRDRFVLSAGHGSALLYALLHLTGYDLSLDDVKQFRQWESRTPGHPEQFQTRGVEATTGPLGQGSANAVGMAIAERWLANYFNRPGFPIVDHFTYALVSDGDLMEGICAEASALAGFLKLGRLIYLYDANNVTLDGPLSQSASEDFGARYEAYGWQVLTVRDGNTDLDALDAAVTAARADTSRPTLILIRTTIGYGSPNKAGSHKAHGEPLGADELALTKAALGWEWPNHSFYVPSEAREQLGAAVGAGKVAHAAWDEVFAGYTKKHPDLAAEWELAQTGELPAGWDADLPVWTTDAKPVATREAAGK
ncbi:MAG: transketolase, partial [Gemmatimonadota bacterium]